MGKKQYIKPEIAVIRIDNTITLQMNTPQAGGDNPSNPGVSTGDGIGLSNTTVSSPFASPFGEQPFGK